MIRSLLRSREGTIRTIIITSTAVTKTVQTKWSCPIPVANITTIGAKQDLTIALVVFTTRFRETIKKAKRPHRMEAATQCHKSEKSRLPTSARLRLPPPAPLPLLAQDSRSGIPGSYRNCWTVRTAVTPQFNKHQNEQIPPAE
jgi:hypothetical protein